MSKHLLCTVHVVDQIHLATRECVIAIGVNALEELVETRGIEWQIGVQLQTELLSRLCDAVTRAVNTHSVWRFVVKDEEQLEKIVERESRHCMVVFGIVAGLQIFASQLKHFFARKRSIAFNKLLSLCKAPIGALTKKKHKTKAISIINNEKNQTNK